jgi:hypothetical protein
MTRPSLRPLALLLALAAGSVAVPAAANVTVTVTGNVARADFALGGTPGVPQYAGTLFLTFDTPIGLTAQNLDITAQIVDPNDPALRARLPGPGVTVPAAFPVLVSVNPPASGGFEFVNAAQVELYTHQLDYTVDSPYRLYKSPHGGALRDLTSDVLAGSIRCRSRTGGFSDFIIVADTRTPYQAVLDSYAALNAEIGDDGIEPLTRAALALDLDESYEEFLEGEYDDAREELDDLELRVGLQAGSTIANRWVAGGALDNDAGDIDGRAATLDFHLRRLIAAGGGGGEGGGEDDDD